MRLSEALLPYGRGENPQDGWWTALRGAALRSSSGLELDSNDLDVNRSQISPSARDYPRSLARLSPTGLL